MDPIDARSAVVLVRHAESEWNASGRWQGQADPPLSARGFEQARTLADRMKGQHASLLVCSDLRRAVQTARAVGTVLGLSPKIDRNLRELDVGKWSGLRREEIEALDPDELTRFESGVPGVRPGGGESRSEIRARAHRAMARWIAWEPEGRIVVVSHLGFIRALLPGEEPDNACLIEVTARDALTRRSRFDAQAQAETSTRRL